jgi:hypothetical protein
MIDRKKLIREYRNKVHPKGVFAIRNRQTGRTFLGSTLNLYNIIERNKFRLNAGGHQNERLQKDWRTCGEGCFTFEILETLPLQEDPAYDYDDDLKILEMIWVEKFRPFSENCYNDNENIRTV